MAGFGFFFLVCLFPAAAGAASFSLKSSSQFLWGENWLGEGNPVVAEYLKFKYDGESKMRFTGYGRVSKDFGAGNLRDTAASGRLYYGYLDYWGFDLFSLRMGRQYTSYSAGGMILDGLTADFRNLSQYAGMAFSAGGDVQMPINSDYSTDRRMAAAASIYLKNAGLTEADISYLRKYDDKNTARETVGVNVASSFRWAKPYARAAYGNLTESFDTIIAGLDIYPTARLAIRGEYYQAYPTFDSTSIYSVFAVDRYSEYLLKTAYDVTARFSAFAAYKRQLYEENDTADVISLGGLYQPTDGTWVNVALDNRQGRGGRLWGGEIYGDYKASGDFKLSAGVQRDMYQRVETVDAWANASRYWLGIKYRIKENSQVTLRMEENVNENFNHRFVGRAAFDISF
ncbi:MAG: hypothetical protein HZA03_06265 [Nitrospinae bacterium]|nr:hypothetical protein [Nitrospinota bacterium]